jgi:hypothetical protein
MVTQYGMSETFGLMGLESIESQYLDGRPVLNCGDDTAAKIDIEVMEILKESYDTAKKLLSDNREVLDKIAEYLFEKETITGKEFMKIFRKIKGIPEPEEAEEAEEESTAERMEGTVDEEESPLTIEERKYPAIEEKPFVIPPDEKIPEGAAVFAKGGVRYTTTAKTTKETPATGEIVTPQSFEVRPKTGMEMARMAAEAKRAEEEKAKALAEAEAKKAARAKKPAPKKAPTKRKKNDDASFPFK